MTVKVTADMVKQLRDRTGVGMAKCKEALDEAHGDMDKAIEILRKAGAASAVKKSARETNEGLVRFKEDASTIVLLEVNAETDFVVKNEKFVAFVDSLAASAISQKPSSLDAFMAMKGKSGSTHEEERAGLIQAIGENIQVRRFMIIPKHKNSSYGMYVHLGGKIACFVEIKGSDSVQDLAKDVAMHIAAEAPEYLSVAEIPEDIIEKEKEIARSQVKNKPADIVEKILAGKIHAFADQVCLVGQKFIKDTNVSVAEHVASVGKKAGVELSIAKFLRWEVGQN